MRVIICGTGAMACLFGARLAPVASVTLVGTWAAAIDAIRARGVRMAGASAASFRVNAARLGEPIEPAELVLILVKTWQNQRVVAYLDRLLSPEGIVLTLQNGLGNREVLGTAAHAGITAAGASLVGPGFIRPGGDGPTHAAAPEWTIDLLRRAGCDAHRCDDKDIEGLIWGKLVANCGINALTALLRVPNGELLTRPDADALMGRAAAECAAVARAKGINLPFDDPAGHAREVARRTAGNLSSMLQDLLRGAPTECDAINGAVVREGLRLKIPTPVNETLRRLVRAAVVFSGE